MVEARALSQRSTIGLGDREVVVTSRVLFEPEAIIMTEVTSEGAILAKSHVTLPRADTRDPERRGGPALASTLQAHHLRYVHTLIGADGHRVAPSAPVPYSAGTLARLRLGPRGEVEEREGEEQVPGTWLRAVYLAVGAFDDVGLDLGTVDRASIRSDTLSVVMARDGECTRVTFVEMRETLPRVHVFARAELARVVLDDQLLAIASFGPDHRSIGIAGPLAKAGVLELESRARRIAKGADPLVTFIDVVYERGRVLVAGHEHGAIVAQAAPDVSAVTLLSGLSTPPSAPVARLSGELSQEEARTMALEALSRVVQASKKHLGFAVIRNYMKRTQKDLELDHSWLSAIVFGIDGKVSLERSEGVASRDFGVGAGALVRGFLTKVEVVAPAIREIDLHGLVEDCADALTTLGFFESNTTETP